VAVGSDKIDSAREAGFSRTPPDRENNYNGDNYRGISPLRRAWRYDDDVPLELFARLRSAA
jgi:hypothetical protein